MNEDKPREFYIVDHTDNTGFSVIEKPKAGNYLGVNTFLVREVLDTDKTPEQIREDAIREVIAALRDPSQSFNIGHAADFVRKKFLK